MGLDSILIFYHSDLAIDISSFIFVEILQLIPNIRMLTSGRIQTTGQDLGNLQDIIAILIKK